ncbi:stage III sporulation protein AE [Aquibacillus koreensis]|uniref:Stage III sporulation protein AE n=1 Tax=Aquibacillus koreensis TaxID=279446 RepID=A0A9X3WFR9_9BACI|nr:stage III sporulation protein AE [Aquibacillus koreensis]MCT2537524.1 stage III sporulation protein AE [Aquibacillus koreensis]MDC3418970.1 stage III sporulation protein AE [Aquibacillus koreensis]
MNQLMKIVVTGLMLSLLCSILPLQTSASVNQSNEIEEQSISVEDISFTEVKRYWNHVVDEYGGYLPGLEKTSFLEFIKNGDSLSIKEWISGLLEFMFFELVMNGKLLGSLIMLTLFCVVLQTLQNSFENKAVSKVAYAIIYMVLIVLALNSFNLAASYANDTISTMSGFMMALLPLMLGLMASFGNLVAVSFFQPIIVFLIHISVLLISTIVIPLFFLSALLNIVSTLSESYKVTRLADLLKNTALWLLAAFLTIFSGVISVQGAATAITDGVAMKTAKFVTGNFIPVVGKMFTDATDTVLSASLLLKNAVGIVGVIILIALVLFPAIKVFVIAIIYKITSALLQPIGDGPVIKCMDIISKHIIYIFAALLVVCFMFFLAIVILVASSNLTLMLR